MNTTVNKYRRSKRNIIIALILLLLTNTFMGITLMTMSKNALRKQIEQRMLDVANTAAYQLDGDDLKGLTADDIGSEKYERAMKTLLSFQINIQLDYIYAIRDEGNDLFTFTIDPDPEDPEDISRDYDDILALSGFYEPAADYLLSFSTDKERFAQFYLKDYEECKVPVEDDYLTISTIHSAKGLEWDHVFIMGLCEGIFPNPFFAQGLSQDKQDEFFNAEWKKMYVAATRARVFLHLSYPEAITRKGFSFRKDPSRFIVSLLPRDYAEQRPRNTYSRPYHPAAARPSAR